MNKRPPIDLMAVTTGQATPMSEGVQRAPGTPSAKLPSPSKTHAAVRTENLEALAFKVSPSFRKRFRQRAVEADLKLNQLLFEALTAWEERHGIKK